MTPTPASLARAREMFVREGTESDFLAIDSLRKKDGSSLGFIPKDAYLSVLTKTRMSNRDRWKYQRIWVVEDNNEITGFVYAIFSRHDVKIEQIVIREDARRWERATKLENIVRQAALHTNATGITCRVAVDIEANYFWRALGYQPYGCVTSTWLNQRESKSKRPLFLYLLDFGTPIFPLKSEEGEWVKYEDAKAALDAQIERDAKR